MKYVFKLDEKNIEIIRSFWLGKTQVIVDGIKLDKQKEDNSYHIKLKKGKVKKMKIIGTGFDGVPRVFIDWEKLEIARKLFWYEYLVSCMPMAIIFVGGAVGAITGAIATVYNLNIIRREYSYATKMLLILAVTVLSIIAYFVLSFLLFQLRA